MSSFLTSTSLGVNNSAPAYALHVTGSGVQLGTLAITTTNSTSTSVRGQIQLNDAARTMAILNNGATAITISSSGGVTLESTLTLPTSFLQTYTPSVTYGGSLTTNGTNVGRYCTFGGLKLAFISVPLKWTASVTGSGATTVSLPTSFFSSVVAFLPSVSSVGNTAYQSACGNGCTTSTCSFYVFSPVVTTNTTSTATVDLIIVGT